MTASTCYACDSLATSVEHVPPRCLFPEKKDLPSGVDLRKQLITVPSCDVHNGSKSRDDEYLLCILVMNIPNNTVAQNHFLTKIMRGFERNPSLIQRIVKGHVPVHVQDTATGDIQSTVAVQVDMGRFTSCLQNIGRALYFHHYGEKWDGQVSVYPAFLLELNPDLSPREVNEPIEKLAATLEQYLHPLPAFGDNPDVFSYKVIDGAGNTKKIMRLSFYGGSHVALFFTR